MQNSYENNKIAKKYRVAHFPCAIRGLCFYDRHEKMDREGYNFLLRYGKLKDTAYFKAVAVDGFSVVWPNGQDICPDELYKNSKIVLE